MLARFDDAISGRGGALSRLAPDLPITWASLRAFVPVDPWPRVRLVWRQDTNLVQRVVGPRWRRDRARFAEDVATAFGFAAARWPARVEPGWLAEADIDWEPVASGGGPYRGTVSPTRTATVRRPAPGPLEGLVALARSLPACDAADQVGEVGLTDAYLYAARRSGLARLPLRALRVGFGAPGHARLYVFGRRVFVALAARPGCPVERLLDARLDARKRTPSRD